MPSAQGIDRVAQGPDHCGTIGLGENDEAVVKSGTGALTTPDSVLQTQSLVVAACRIELGSLACNETGDAAASRLFFLVQALRLVAVG